MIRSFADLIGLWPSIGEYADDMGIPYVTAQMQRYRNSVSPKYWPKIVEAAEARDFDGVTLELLTSLGGARGSRRRAA